MSNFTRRELLAGAAGLAAAGTLGLPSFAQVPSYTPEEGASLRLLRWVPFVKSEEAAWNANTQAFTEATGIAVQIDQESWEDVRPKAAVAANPSSTTPGKRGRLACRREKIRTAARVPCYHGGEERQPKEQRADGHPRRKLDGPFRSAASRPALAARRSPPRRGPPPPAEG